jgi:basic membrane protein A
VCHRCNVWGVNIMGISWAIGVVACMLLAVSCGTRESAPADVPLSEDEPVRVGIVFDAGGKDDKSFNTACWEGAVRAQKEFGIELRDVEPGDPSAVESAIRGFAERGFDLVIGIGGAAAPHIDDVAGEFPQGKFAVVDDAGKVVNQPNAVSLTFEEHKGSFLVGVIAAAKSQTGIIGFIGGMDIPLIRKFELGYELGAKYVNPDIEVLQNYAGVTAAAWTDKTRGRELAMSQYGRGADVIFAAAGLTGLGVFDAAEETGNFVIGVDANQNYIKPGHVLTSMLKRSDIAVYETIESVVNGTFEGGRRVMGLENDGVGYAVDDHNRELLTPEIVAKVEEAKRKILAGEIVVPDYTETGGMTP